MQPFDKGNITTLKFFVKYELAKYFYSNFISDQQKETLIVVKVSVLCSPFRNDIQLMIDKVIHIIEFDVKTIAF